MSTYEHLELLLQDLDPVSGSYYGSDPDRQEAIWSEVVMRRETIPVVARHRPRQYVGAAAMAAAVAAALLFTGFLTGVSSNPAAATDLRAAARVDAPAANLPVLQTGQYLYEKSLVTLTCQVGSPSLEALGTASVTYISKGTMESWTNDTGTGRVVIHPDALLQGGSRFATPAQKSLWLRANKPFVPCALGGANNLLGQNPANYDTTGHHGGSQTTISGYSGFGFVLTSTPVKSQVVWGTNVVSLPNDVTRVSALLSNGQVNAHGVVSSYAHPCPLGSNESNTIGCTIPQQLALIQQLLQLPDASAKFGSVLYQVAARMEGASVFGPVTNAFGRTGVGVDVPTGPSTRFRIVLDQKTGALLEAAALVANSANSHSYSSIGAISYGSVQVVSGFSRTPVTN